MNPWETLKKYTQAKIGLHRSGHSLSTQDLLDFRIAHALAYESVRRSWDIAKFEKKLKALGDKPLRVASGVASREQYLKYPGFGRKLSKHSYRKLARQKDKHPIDIVFIITDGLSTAAVDSHALPFWKILKDLLPENFPGLRIALVLVPFGRVGLSDDIGEALGAKMSVMLVGERPGLTSIDSLGIYITYAPKAGNTDANRNCISNIHPPEGLDYNAAAEKLLFIMSECWRLKISGVSVKDERTLASRL